MSTPITVVPRDEQFTVVEDAGRTQVVATGQTINAGGGGGSGSVTSVSGTAPIQVATGTTTPVVSIAAATTSAPGSMSAADKAKLDGVAAGATANAGTVTSVSVATANGVSGSVATATTTPAITLTLGAITPTSVAASGSVTGANLSGTNTGDQDLSGYQLTSGLGTAAFQPTSAFATAAQGAAADSAVQPGDPVSALANDAGYTANAGTVTSVSGVGAIHVATGTTTPVISVDAATTSAPGTMSAADKTKLDGVAAGATANAGTVTSVSGTAPIVVATGTTTPAISIDPATTSAAGSMSAADKAKLDGVAPGATANAGTVTSASVVTANGLAGSVATATTTPAITMSTTVTGILKGDGTAISAAAAGDFPTLNQSTTGTAANVTGTVAVANGGTGATTLSANAVLLGNGTSALQTVAPGATGNVLTSNGTTWASSAPAGGSTTNTYKEAVRVASTANVTLASAVENGDAIDGVTLATGNRVLLKNQTTASENGIYVVNASGAPTRATDFDATGAEVANGAIIPVQAGTVNGGSLWQLVANGGTIGNNFVFAPVGSFFMTRQNIMTPPIATGGNTIVAGGSVNAGAVTGSVLIGFNAQASDNNCVVIGGSSASGNLNSVSIGATAQSGTRSVAIGSSANVASAVSIGEALTNSNVSSIAIGQNTNTEMSGEFSLGFGTFASVGDFKVCTLGMRMQTTNATPTELGLSTARSADTGPAGRIVLANNAAYIFDCDIVARQNTTGDMSAWNLKFAIKRGANAAATTLMGSPTATLIAQDSGASAWAVAVTADTTNGRPAIGITGEASKTIRWVANVRMTKVGG
jgi:hypothetical protein